MQLYELGVLTFAFLLLSRVSLREAQPGTVAVLAAVSYGIIRFVLEYLRADGVIAFGNLTLTQLHCIALVAITLLIAKISMIRPHAARHQHS